MAPEGRLVSRAKRAKIFWGGLFSLSWRNSKASSRRFSLSLAILNVHLRCSFAYVVVCTACCLGKMGRHKRSATVVSGSVADERVFSAMNFIKGDVRHRLDANLETVYRSTRKICSL